MVFLSPTKRQSHIQPIHNFFLPVSVMKTDNVISTYLLPWEHEIIIHGYSNDMPMNDKCFDPIGGDIGTECSDFEVEEIPAYQPCGTGEHLYLWIEKTAHPTQDLIRIAERIFNVRESAIGCAGKKDTHATTRQWISIQTHLNEVDVQDRIEQFSSHSWLKILKYTRHTNKLRTGHLIGNHFKIRLNHVTAEDQAIHHACEILMHQGFINYFGRQRFGFERANVAEGLKIMAGARAKHQQRLLYINAIQSALFNLTAARRFHTCGMKAFEGDVMRKHNAGCFICDAPDIDNARVENHEIYVTLPLPGKKTMHGHGFTEELEAKALEDFISCWKQQPETVSYDFSSLINLADGDRRQMWIFPENLIFHRQDNESITVDFTLSSGSYATILLRHLCGPSFTR